jgi:hypothetical protein
VKDIWNKINNYFKNQQPILQETSNSNSESDGIVALQKSSMGDSGSEENDAHLLKERPTKRRKLSRGLRLNLGLKQNLLLFLLLSRCVIGK